MRLKKEYRNIRVSGGLWKHAGDLGHNFSKQLEIEVTLALIAVHVIDRNEGKRAGSSQPSTGRRLPPGSTPHRIRGRVRARLGIPGSRTFGS